MFPGVGPVAVGGDVADGVTGNSLSVVARQQIAPVTVAVGVVDGLNGGTQLAGGVGILFAAQDITGVIVGPGVGKITGLVVLPQQLVGTVVNIAGGMRAVRDAEDVAVVIVGIGIGNIVAVGIYGVSRYLSTGLSRTGTLG